MTSVKWGRVKYFANEKGYGFITPDEGFGSQDVYFHVKYYSGISETYPGELDLKFSDDATLSDPRPIIKRGDVIVYQDMLSPGRDNRRMAIHWLYPEILRQAEDILARRSGSPSNFPVRVRQNTEIKGSAAITTFWEGTNQEFDCKLDEGFSQMHDTNFWVERLLINGAWERMWHPTGWHPKYKQQA